MKCKKCGEETTATLCNMCFLDEITEALELGEDDPSKILRGMVTKYGRLRGLKSLPMYRTLFGKPRIRRVITTETGERCRLVPSYDGWVAVTIGPRSKAEIVETPEEKIIRYPGESAEGGRVITYYEGQTPVLVVRKPTALVFPRPHHIKRTGRAFGEPPPKHYKSPLAHKRPKSPLDKPR